MQAGLVAGVEDHQRGFRRIVRLLIWLVIVPTALLLAVGILMLVLWEAELQILFGILTVTLVGCLVTGGVLSLVLLRREARLSELQLDFVSKVSHELRTPLTSIRMFVDMLHDAHDRDPKEVEVCLDVLKGETVRLTGRIERLLDWGRMAAGRRVYDRRADSIEAVVADALAAFDAANVGRQHHVDLVLDDGVPQVIVDRGALVDALVNLLSNAVKYTREDKQIVLRVSSDPRWVRLAVSDNGVGVSRAEQKWIFQKFYRADDRLSRVVEGTGLGLAIVTHVAHGHQGKVELDSEVGRGSTFTILIPHPTEAELADVEGESLVGAS